MGQPLPSPLATPMRRRGEALEHAIFAAVIDQLAVVGYGAFTMEGVAAAAGTGKAALYRRWANKDELIVAVLDANLPSFADIPDTGSVRGDLLSLLRRLAALLNSSTGCALRSLFSDGSDAERVAMIKERAIAPRQELMMAMLQRGVERGEVRPAAVTRRVAEVGPALLVQRHLTGGRVTDAEVQAVVDEIVMPLIQA